MRGVAISGETTAEVDCILVHTVISNISSFHSSTDFVTFWCFISCVIYYSFICSEENILSKKN